MRWRLCKAAFDCFYDTERACLLGEWSELYMAWGLRGDDGAAYLL
jgi:hypothetical protein